MSLTKNDRKGKQWLVIGHFRDGDSCVIEECNTLPQAVRRAEVVATMLYSMDRIQVEKVGYTKPFATFSCCDTTESMKRTTETSSRSRTG